MHSIFVNDDKYVVRIDVLGLMYLILDSKFYLLVVLFWLHIPSQLRFDHQVSVQQTNLSSENTIDPNKEKSQISIPLLLLFSTMFAY